MLLSTNVFPYFLERTIRLFRFWIGLAKDQVLLNVTTCLT